MELLDYEKKHISYLMDNAYECSLFLKRNNEFPLDKPCKIVLVGNGGRQTIKGGTGSGDVASRFFSTIEEALTKVGFDIISTDWMDKYDSFKKSTHKAYVKEGYKLARSHKILPSVYSMGYFENEKNYSFSAEYDCDVCVYVLARNSGEGNDRRNISGDVKLSEREIKDINYLNNKHKKFMLVLNVGGVVDLSPVMNVRNILLLSQLGVVTGDAFTGILLGKYNPSGKLSTTWAIPEDYPFFNEFGDENDTYYKEGIYVGYRYFSTVGKKPLFPFGFGLSYTDFEIKSSKASVEGMKLKAIAEVKNIGSMAGKEVVQCYLTKPNGRIDNPKYELCGYKKTNVIEPKKKESISFEIDLTEFASYDSFVNNYVLLKGDYILSIGNSVENATAVLKATLDNDVVVEKLEGKLGYSGFMDYKPDNYIVDEVDVAVFKLDSSSVKTKTIEYKKNVYIDPLIEKMSNDELADICLGQHNGGWAEIVGASCVNVVGGAGETVLRNSKIKNSLTMADGPAGLRLKTEYGVDKKGIYDTALDPIMEKMIDFLPKASAPFIKPPKNRHGKIHHQYTTAIPIGTALAQSFNDELVSECGNIVREEMEIFNVDLWLAPALNIHRNILCGRNFEYYSEDPYLSGTIACAMIKGVEKGDRGVTIKHFAFNNQELNRTNNNSHVSQRAAREIYLKGFERCIKECNPKSIMTSYNLINGVHTSESIDLINDILRCEWGYDGLVMTDWVKSGRNWCKKSIYPATYASRNVKSGNDLTMPGCTKDHKDIIKALKKGFITREELVVSASRVFRAIEKQKNK